MTYFMTSASRLKSTSLTRRRAQIENQPWSQTTTRLDDAMSDESETQQNTDPTALKKTDAMMSGVVPVFLNICKNTEKKAQQATTMNDVRQHKRKTRQTLIVSML